MLNPVDADAKPDFSDALTLEKIRKARRTEAWYLYSIPVLYLQGRILNHIIKLAGKPWPAQARFVS